MDLALFTKYVFIDIFLHLGLEPPALLQQSLDEDLLVEVAEFGNRVVNNAPDRSLWVSGGADPYDGQMGKHEAPPVVTQVVPALRACGVDEQTVLAATVMQRSWRRPWEVSWRPENDLGDASEDCVRLVLQGLPWSEDYPTDRGAVWVFRTLGADL